jgi:hypothetical protein
MNSRYTFLRLLVLAGCSALILGGPRITRVRAYTEDCIKMLETPNQPCPSSCTSSSYNYWYLNGSGFQGTDFNQTPCGGSKPGQTCSQAEEYNPPSWDCPDPCCLSTGETCSPDECNAGNPCCGYANCNTEKGGVCCIANGVPCENDAQCCYTQCVNDICCEPVGTYPCTAGQCCPGLTCVIAENQCEPCGEENEPCCDTGQPCDPDCCTCVGSVCQMQFSPAHAALKGGSKAKAF